MMKRIIKYLLSIILLSGLITAGSGCDSPNTGTEMYDGDSGTRDEVPDDMQEKTEEMQRQNQKRGGNSGSGGSDSTEGNPEDKETGDKKEGDASQTENPTEGQR